MLEHDIERIDAEKGVRRSRTSDKLADQKKATAEPEENRLRQGALTVGPEALLELQQTRGNAYVQRLLKSRAVQAKLTVNPPDDQYEREADAVAATFAQTPGSQIQRQAAPEEEEEKLQAKLQRQANEEEEEKVQTKAVAGAVPEVSEGLEERINAARGSGKALPGSLRSSIEPALGHDFSQVRLHTDAEADGLSRQLGAKAFTTGQDVFFREGDYQPDTQEGMNLIGHELTHVVQQGAARGVTQRRVEVRSPATEHALTDVATVAASKLGRPLSQEEIAIAEPVFGKSIEYGRVRIVAVGKEEMGRTAGNNIVVPESFDINDSSWAQLFIHEMVHVWQYQTTGTSYISKSLWEQITLGKEAYEPEIIPGKKFFEYRVEEQASIVERYYAMREYLKILVRKKDLKPKEEQLKDRLQSELAIYKAFIDDMRKQLPISDAKLFEKRCEDLMKPLSTTPEGDIEGSAGLMPILKITW